MFLYTAVIFCMLPLANAKAADISVVFGDDFPIVEENIAPGEVFERSFTVTNVSGSNQDLMIRFDDRVDFWIPSGFSIEDVIFVQLRRPDGTLSTMPNNNTEESLRDLFIFNDAFIFDTLAASDSSPKNYKLIFTFSKDAGNEYQNKKTVFDTAVGIDSVEAGISSSQEERVSSSDNSDDGDGDSSNRRNNDGDENASLSLASASVNQVEPSGGNTNETLGGDASETGEAIVENGEVAGEQTQGQEIPQKNNYWNYPLILLVIVLLSRVGYIFFRKINKKYKLN